MAMVLDAFASYLQNMLTEMAREELGMLLGVSSEIDRMGVTLRDLKNFLADADRRRITDQSVQGWVRELKGAMYDATDILDLCQLSAMDQRAGASTANLGCCNPLLFCLRNPLFAHDIGSRIKALNQRLGGIKERSASFSFVNLGSYEEERSSRVHASRETTGEPVRSGVVGDKIGEDTRELVEMLAEKECNSNIMVVAIVGVGGIGKTTLAWEVFSDEAIQHMFDKRIWLSVYQDFDKVELLRTAITLAGGDHRGKKAMGVLQRALKDALTGKKLLLVMDDVWSHGPWLDVLETPLLNAAAAGSRVLVTTRDERVARGMKAVRPYHHVDKLGPEDAWSLLKQQVVSSELDESKVDMLKDIGMEIIARCGGLPLAVKVMGGLLCKRDKRRRDWEKVLNSIWSVSEMPQELNYAIYFSYEDLPSYMKQCFLHCSLLPKNTLFTVHDIVGMWISEGFLDGNSDKLEELGSECYNELILRNLIERDTPHTDQWDYNMHDVVRSFAQYVAREEALVVQAEQTHIISYLALSKFRRLSIESTESIPEWAVLQKQVSLRALIINCTINFKVGDSLSRFPSLRVLYIRLAESDRLVDSLCQLKHLRFLYVYDTDISRLPDDIDKMYFLQHIGIVNCEQFVRLPDSIINLAQLRSLDLVESSVNVVPRGIGRLTNLRSFFGFPVHIDGGWCSLEELEPLSRLRDLRLEGLENVHASSLAARARISSKAQLSYLHLNCNNNSYEVEQQQLIEEVFDELRPPPCLERLVIERYFGRRLPNWMQAPTAAAFRTLRYMTLHNLTCCTKLPDGLCQLPLLQNLRIHKAPAIKRLGPEFLHHGDPPQVMAAFPRLHELVFYGMVEWDDWEWEKQVNVQAMPALEVLIIQSCKLRSLPPGLSFQARALNRLVITGARHLQSLDNFGSVVELDVCFSPELRRIANLPKLRKLTIVICPKLTVLEGVSELQSLVMEDYEMKTLPGYLKCVNPRYLLLDCTLKLLKSIFMQDSREWDKISHIRHVKAYAEDGGDQRKWYVLYRRDPYNFDTNINSISISRDDDELVGSDSPSGSTDHDELVGSDSPSGSTVALCKDNDKLASSDIPSGSTVALCKDKDKLAGIDIPSGSTVDLCKDDGELVGTGSPCENIIKVLMQVEDTGKQQLEVVSICGIGGLGKTTIANAVYRKIANEFDHRAFVSVSPRPDMEKIIRSIIGQVDCPYPNFEECDIQQLIDVLKNFLQDRRYLIVVDDIWDISEWELIKPALIGNNCRSGIITTTRKIDVAESIGGVYKLPLLSYEDSKKLFYRRTIFGSEDHCPSQYRELSKEILNKCGQLPLAIIAITSLLPNQLMAIEEWRKVSNSIGSGLEIGDSMNVMRLMLSCTYDDLPQHLKTCLLYLGIFTEDYVITRDSLVQRWIAEGLIPVETEQSLQELGESYFYQLVNTGMIQPTDVDSDVFRVPVMMLDFIIYLSNKEKIVTTLAEKQQTDLPHEVERLSLQVSNERHAVPKLTKSFRSTSSLSISCGADSMPSLSNYKNLRVLVLEGRNSLENRHIKYLGNLHLLSYLIVVSIHITEIPKKVGNLQFLRTLDLRASSVKELPCTIIRLRQLQCLLINRSTKVPAGIGNLQALEELADIDICKSPNILEDICTMPELRVLRIALWSWDELYSKLLPETLCKLSTKKLKYLSIFTCCSLDFKSDDIQPVLVPLEKLEVRRCTFNTLPEWIGKLESLRSLSIEVYLLEKEALRILGELPALLFLSLTAKRTTPEERLSAKKTPEEGLTAERLVVGCDGFRCLKTFLLFNRAMGITFAKDAMQNLERLELSFQVSLTKDLCFGLENLSSLKRVQVEIVCFSATDGTVKDAEGAIRSMIRKYPKQPRPALDIKRTVEEYMIEDQKKSGDLFISSWNHRTASIQRQKRMFEQDAMLRVNSNI